MDGVAGTYVMDVGRNTPRTVTDEEGKEREVISEDIIQKLQKDGESDTLEMKDNGTFTLRMAGFVTSGTWEETKTGIVIRTTEVNGEPAPKEVQDFEDVYGVERGFLVKEIGDKKLYFKKRKPE